MAYYSVLHRMTLIGHAQFSQFMEWLNLGIKTLKYAIYAPNDFLKLPENQIPTNFVYLTSSNFVTVAMNFLEVTFDRKSYQKLFIVTWCVKRSLWIMFLNTEISAMWFFWGWLYYCKRTTLEKWLQTGLYLNQCQALQIVKLL